MILDRLVKIFTSLKLTVVLLTLGILLVFAGTIAQVNIGLYAQNEFFRSFFVFWPLTGAGSRIPVFPGGYMIGGLLVINLFAAHFRYYRKGVKKVGLIMIHLGLVMLLLGQLLTDLLAIESKMHIREGETINYSEVDSYVELVVIDKSGGEGDRVTAIPQDVLARDLVISNASLPFVIRVNKFYPNSQVSERAADATATPPATQGFGPRVSVQELPQETQMNSRDMPSAVIELVTPQGSLGTWFVSQWIDQPQHAHLGDKEFEVVLRPQRLYKPYSLHLVSFTHEVYPGTGIPKDFSSLVRVLNPKTGEDRQVRIYMNNPLRYGGETYYQSSFDPDDRGTVLQVVRNPGWLTPYFACLLVGLGLVWQFLVHLIPFLKRKVAL